MKNIIYKSVLSGLFISMVISCNPKTEGSSFSQAEKEQIKKEIQAKEDEFARVFNSGEMKQIGYYADDATTFYQNRPPLIGKEAIVEFLKSDLDSNTNIISFKTNEVFPSSDGNQVVEIGYFKLTDSAKYVLNTGNYMVLFEKRNGKYVCVRDMSTSDMPVR
jgi:ketosteroid isomerase-like protein